MTPDKTTRTLSLVRASSDPIGLDGGEKVYIGVKVHKCTYHVALASNHRVLITMWVQPARSDLLLERLRPIRKRDV